MSPPCDRLALGFDIWLNMDWVFFPSDWALSGVDLCDLLGNFDLLTRLYYATVTAWAIMVLTGESNFEPTCPGGD